MMDYAELAGWNEANRARADRAEADLAAARAERDWYCAELAKKMSALEAATETLRQIVNPTMVVVSDPATGASWGESKEDPVEIARAFLARADSGKAEA